MSIPVSTRAGTRTRRGRSRVLAAVVLVAPALLLTSCLELPTTGPVTEANQPGLLQPVTGVYHDPAPPPPGAKPDAIVTGFLDAMTAVPLQTAPARQYLSTSGAAQWRPQDGLVVYDSPSAPRGRNQVTVQLHGARFVDGRGTWRGRLPRNASRTTFPMTQQNGQWRISRAPDALLVPAGWYAQNISTSSIYFPDPSGRILVPEPVHVPDQSQLATALVRSLLLGPAPSLDGVVHSFIPSGLSLSQSVTPHAGVADVSLRGSSPVVLSARTARLVVGQFAWTLAQVPGVRSFQLSISGNRISDATGESTFPVAQPDGLDPTDSLASGQLYALRNGRLVSGQAKAPGPVDGPFGAHDEGLRSFAVSLDGIRVAGVTRTRLLLGSVQGTSQNVTQVLQGNHLLRPAWDFADRLWDIDQTPHGAAVVVVENGVPHAVHVHGISGTHVTHFLVSRDGSRLVAAVRGPHNDRLMISRIRYAPDDSVSGASRARRLPWVAGGSTRIGDLGWLSPTSVGVLHLLTSQISEVRTISVDGSTQPGQALSVSLPGRSRGLATSPVPTDTSFAIMRNSLYDLAQTTPDVPVHGLRAITYAG